MRTWGSLAGKFLPVDRINQDRCCDQMHLCRWFRLIGHDLMVRVDLCTIGLVAVAKFKFALLLVVEMMEMKPFYSRFILVVLTLLFTKKRMDKQVGTEI